MDRRSTPQKRRYPRRIMLQSAAVGAGLAAVTVACGRQGPSGSTGSGPAASSGGTPRPGGTLNPEALYGNPPSLDPHQTSSTWTMLSTSRVYSRLFRFKTGQDPKIGQDRDTENDVAVSLES